MKTRFIFNPWSGRNRRRPRLASDLATFVAAHQLDAAIVFTECPGHATELARAALADGCERIVAVGGDGTMNEIAQALVGSPAALALVPCGSGNGLALHLGLPTQPRRSLELLVDATARVVAIDTGTANGHPFFNAMGLGFDAEISRRFNRLTRRGLPAYARTGLAAFLRHRPERVTISDSNGTRETLDTFIVAVANSDQYGNHAQVAPGARVDDGLLDLVAVRPPGPFGAVPLVTRLFLGTFDRSPRVWRRRGSHFVIERPAPGLIHTDGETHSTAAVVDVAVRPRSLRLLVPAGCRVASSL
jgi:diacylglycerol kinase (ATP)